MKHIWIWMRRWKHCRGFGVQSPWAYRFIRYVINEHYPYYAYNDLDRKYHHASFERKMGRLVFRLVNHWQPVAVFGLDEVYVPFAQAASKKIALEDVSALAAHRGEQVLVFAHAADLMAEEKRNELIGAMNRYCLLAVDGIHQDKEALELWKRLQKDERTGVSFDLYYCGIIFFEKDRYKQHYIVNF